MTEKKRGISFWCGIKAFCYENIETDKYCVLIVNWLSISSTSDDSDWGFQNQHVAVNRNDYYIIPNLELFRISRFMIEIEHYNHCKKSMFKLRAELKNLTPQ